jgi:molecular chaperone GrpE
VTDEPRIEAEAEAEAETEADAVAEPTELEAVTRERDGYLDALQRTAAEFDNFRKRVLRDQEALVARAGERLVRELLPVLDDLERALQAAEERSSRYGVSGADASADDRLRQAYADEAKLEDGVRLVHRSLAELLRREGLEEIDTEGRFDPHVHEALLSQPAEAESGSVLEVLQKGYKLGDRVLRPSRVIVAE